MIDLREIIEVTEQEVDWHTTHREISGKSADWEEGFIAGMQHIAKLSKQVNNLPGQTVNGSVHDLP